MAGLAIVRALNIDDQPVKVPKRIPSSQLIDKMRPIPEDALPTPSPRLQRRNFSFTSASDLSTEVSGETIRLLEEITEEPSSHLGLNIFLSFMTVISMVAQVISTPLYTDAMSDEKAGSDAFVASLTANLWTPVIFFILHILFNVRNSPKEVFQLPAPWRQILLAGLLAGLNSMLVAFTSLPERVPTYLQAILHQLLIPFTALARYIMLGKGINRKQFVCIVVVFIGMFITLEPSMFSMREKERSHSVADSNPEAWYFYFIYALAWLPMAFGIVLMEKGLKEYEWAKDKGQSLSYVAWLQSFVVLSHLLFFWIDFVPTLGMANSGSTNFLEKLDNGFQCFYGLRESCRDVPELAVLYLISTACVTVFFALLVRFAESAVFTVVVLALVTPISTLFWNIFSPIPSFHYEPFFDLATLFILAGLAIMVPGVIMYTYFARYELAENSKPRMRVVPDEEVPLRYQQGKPKITKKRSWTVAYVTPEGRSPFAPPLPSNSAQILDTKKKKKKKRNMRRTSSAPVLMGGF